MNAGHQIGINAWTYTALSTLSNEQIVSELANTLLIVEDVLGSAPSMFHPPFMDIDERVRALAKSMGLSVVESTAGTSMASAVSVAFQANALPKIGPIALEPTTNFVAINFMTSLSIIQVANYQFVRMDQCTALSATMTSIRTAAPANNTNGTNKQPNQQGNNAVHFPNRNGGGPDPTAVRIHQSGASRIYDYLSFSLPLLILVMNV